MPSSSPPPFDGPPPIDDDDDDFYPNGLPPDMDADFAMHGDEDDDEEDEDELSASFDLTGAKLLWIFMCF